MQCDVCCRFPERDSLLRPYFTAEEIRRATARGVDPSHFPDPNGCQVSVVPTPSGEGYLCPAFDPQTSHCRIYEDRPLDCQIYPLAVMWTPPAAVGDRRSAIGDRPESSPLPIAHSPLPAVSGEKPQVVLGWDTKCPFLKPGNRQWAIGDGQESSPLPITHDPLPGLRAYAEKITELLERDETIETFANNPRLIGRFQEDVVVLRPLPKLSERMRAQFDVQRSKLSENLEPRTSNLELHPLTHADHDRFRQALVRVDTPLAHFALAPHLIWRHLFTYSWAEIEDHLCLFADYADGIYMPLPPLPVGVRREALDVRRGAGGPEPRTSNLEPAKAALNAAFALMRARNRGSAVSRIENVPEEWGARLETMGYRVKPKDPDYLYRAADLVALAGDPYKSQRAACNRFEREQRYSFEPYRDEDREACLALFLEWSAQKQAAGLEDAGRHMLVDSEAAHREALTVHRDLDLVGRVVRVDGRIRAYTFGYRRSPSVLCVLLEVADRTIPGLAPFFFREFCREAAAGGSELINTMDDSGLLSLAHAKRIYHPIRLIPSYIVTEA